MNTYETCGFTGHTVELYLRVDGRWAYGCQSSDLGCLWRWQALSKQQQRRGFVSEGSNP